MTLLHGSWSLAGTFFVWGETWQRVQPYSCGLESSIPTYPLAVPFEDLINTLKLCQLSESDSYELSLKELKPIERTIAIPTSVELEPPSATNSRTSPKARSSQSNTTARKSASRKSTSSKSASRSGKSASKSAITQKSIQTETSSLQLLPLHSADRVEDSANLVLFPWQVPGIQLNPSQAFAFLTRLPLMIAEPETSYVGSELRLWCHIARWSLDLLTRSKFLPTLQLHKRIEAGNPEAGNPEAGNLEMGNPEAVSQEQVSVKQGYFQAQWRTVLDSAIDRQRFERFVREMPLSASMVSAAREQTMGNDRLNMQKSAQFELRQSESRLQPIAMPYPTSPRLLLQNFLDTIVDAQVRSALRASDAPKLNADLSEWPQVWLQSLNQDNATIEVDPEITERFAAILQRWAIPLETNLQNQFRTCLTLQTPRSGKETWYLSYGLQADDNPELKINAAEIWQHPIESWVYQGHTIHHPQETLLRGLGLAVRLYPRLEPSLDTIAPEGCELSPDDAYNFIKTVAWKLQDNGLTVVLPPSLSHLENGTNRLGLSIRAELTGMGKTEGLGLENLLKFQWELSLGGQTFSQKEFEKLVAQETSLVEVNGEWLELRPQDVRSAREFFANRKDQPNLSLEDALRISSGDAQTLSKLPIVDFEASGALQELVTTLTGNQAVAPLPAPKSFKGQLRPYQERGVGWLRFLHRWNLGACLADDMGLGKTIEFIAFLLHLHEEDLLNHPVLLVCPTSVLGNWEREVKRFAPGLRVTVHHGDNRLKGKRLKETVQSRHLIITSYALVYRDLQDLKPVNWHGVVLDEAQNIKNPDAKQSQAVRELATTVSTFRVALTGTPVENRLSELWSIMDFLNPGYLGPRNFFQRRFTIPIERYGDTDSLATLRSLVQPFILRRLKTDKSIIQDLPEKHEMPVFCGLSEEQAKLYQQAVNSTMTEIEAAEGIQRRGLVLALLTKLKQICNHPTLFLKETGQEKQLSLQRDLFRGRSAKLRRLEEMLEEVFAEGDRALIFTQFAEWGKLLKAYLQYWSNWEVFFLYGSVKKAQREEMVDRFQLDPQAPRIMILSLKAGGVGLNLTRANHVFHFDRWWNPAVENQATDRAFRIGQTRNVQVHKFVCSGTLEEKIHDLIESKKALAEQVVGNGENWLTDLDTNQLRNLLLLDRNAVIDD